MKVSVTIDLVSIKKVDYTMEDGTSGISYQGFTPTGVKIKLSEGVFNALVSKKVPEGITLAKDSKITIAGEDGLISI